MVDDIYDIAVIGGGVSGTALAYALSKYSNVPKIALIEKYEDFGQVNSAANNNSQTLHVGDIETNYTFDKVKQVRPASMMVKCYTDGLLLEERERIIKKTPKMLLAVGESEVRELDLRYESLRSIFPQARKLDREEIAAVEPELMRGRSAMVPIRALVNEGYAVNFGELARSLMHHAEDNERVRAYMGTEVVAIRKDGEGYTLLTNKGAIRARAVVVDADAFSLDFAKRLGYGHEYSLIPIAGTFYFSPELLRGKVYTMQLPDLPFAAVHGDPDLTRLHATRWGPTARFFPVLEARNYKTISTYLRSSGLNRVATWTSLLSILGDPVRFTYLVKNIFYELPYIGKYFFLPQVRKIAPSIRARDLRRAKGYGGMRLQRVDTRTKELLLGEGKIIGDHIIFNMTPSPGASVCLYNAMRDGEELERIFNGKYVFDAERMKMDLGHVALTGEEDISLKTSYPS